MKSSFERAFKGDDLLIVHPLAIGVFPWLEKERLPWLGLFNSPFLMPDITIRWRFAFERPEYFRLRHHIESFNAWRLAQGASDKKSIWQSMFCYQKREQRCSPFLSCPD